MEKLTDKMIRDAEPPAKGRRLVFDGHREAPKGFALKVLPSGKRGFALRYLHRGRDRLVHIGDYPTWTLTAAREQASRMRREIDAGTDLLEQRRAERAEPTVSDVIGQFLEARAAGKQSAKRMREVFRLHVAPAIGRKKIRDVRRRDVVELCERLAADRGRQAALTLTYVKQLFTFAEDREYIDASPVATLKPERVHPNMKARRRQRVLSADELNALWHTETAKGIDRTTLLALKLVLITGQRPGEVAGMRESEISGATWTIPAERRMKTESAHTVPLTATALALIEQARALRGNGEGDAIFTRAKGRPLGTQGIAKAASRAADALGNEPDPTGGHWTPHDLRRTARTGMAAAGVSEIIAELAVGHTRKGIAAVYDQHRYEGEIRAALEAWEARLLAIVGANI